MKVIGVRADSGGSCEAVEMVYGLDHLEEAVRETDFVVLALPLTENTDRLLNAERLAWLKQDAYLINVGRGALIDEDALVEALRSRSFAGVALDVTTQEPLSPNSPLWEMENVLLTPHTAGLTNKMWERHYAAFAENLKRFLKDEPLLWIVDKSKGC
jgi:phosphoglycerate dehydrogenase-like enzyme